MMTIKKNVIILLNFLNFLFDEHKNRKANVYISKNNEFNYYEKLT